MPEVLKKIYRRSPVLSLTGGLHLALLLLALCAAWFDPRTILGLNPWMKPMKFMISITVYLWTLAWFIAYLPGPRWALRCIAWGTSAAMLVEIACISGQAARGTTSHFNVSTSFDSLVFGIMGNMITVNTLLAGLLLFLFWIKPTDLPRVYLWGIRLGLILFLAGSIEGGVMIARSSHTVGASDGGPGLPVLNWSTQAGDLRIAHLLGLHALQVIPLAGFLFGRWKPHGSQPLIYLGFLTVIYGGIMLSLFLQAMDGDPLIGP